MNDKRFLKVKKVSEERYFKSNYEFSKFIEKQNKTSIEDLLDIYSHLLERDVKLGRRFWHQNLNLDADYLKIGNFLFNIYRGYYVRTSGDYTINILAVQKTDNLSANDIDNLLGIEA